MNCASASKHPMKMYRHKGSKLHIFWTQYYTDISIMLQTPEGLNSLIYYINYRMYKYKWHPDFELPNMRNN
jgi:hypothetical protein